MSLLFPIVVAISESEDLPVPLHQAEYLGDWDGRRTSTTERATVVVLGVRSFHHPVGLVEVCGSAKMDEYSEQECLLILVDETMQFSLVHEGIFRLEGQQAFSGEGGGS